jgi:hypothetical protein
LDRSHGGETYPVRFQFPYISLRNLFNLTYIKLWKGLARECKAETNFVFPRQYYNGGETLSIYHVVYHVAGGLSAPTFNLAFTFALGRVLIFISSISLFLPSFYLPSSIPSDPHRLRCLISTIFALSSPTYHVKKRNSARPIRGFDIDMGQAKLKI